MPAFFSSAGILTSRGWKDISCGSGGKRDGKTMHCWDALISK
nr:hypothetical protein [Candidatus Nitrosotalea sp. TS]